MPDVSTRRRETGAGTAGRFAAEEHPESPVSIPAKPVLAARTVEWARNLTGTYDADSTDGYYEAMGEIFDAAGTVAVSSVEDTRTAALREEAELLSGETGVAAEDIENFQDAVQYVTPGTADWSLEMDTWADAMDCGRPTAVDIDTRMRAASAGAPARHRAERRADLEAKQAEIIRELAELDDADAGQSQL